MPVTPPVDNESESKKNQERKVNVLFSFSNLTQIADQSDSLKLESIEQGSKLESSVRELGRVNFEVEGIKDTLRGMQEQIQFLTNENLKLRQR